MASDLKWALEGLRKNPVYGVLNACRIDAYLKETLVLSKIEGAEWAIENMPVRFRSVITMALQAYRSLDQKGDTLDVHEARQLLEYVTSAIDTTS